MNERYIRELPFPAVSNFTADVVAQIKAIPDNEIGYTEEEKAWMGRAVRNLDLMIESATSSGLATEELIARRAQLKAALG